MAKIDPVKIIEECHAFMKKVTSGNANNWRHNMQWARDAYTGDYWTQEKRDDYGLDNSYTVRHHSALGVIVPQYVSELCEHPYHITLEENRIANLDKMQNVITKFENNSRVKTALRSAIEDAVICGTGYVHLLAVSGTGVKAEAINNLSSVYIDPLSHEYSCEDAKEACIVTWISKAEAKEKYGVEVDTIKPSDTRCWNNGQEVIAYFVYYKKHWTKNVDEYGNTVEKEYVMRYEIVGNTFAKPPVNLNISIIPIVRVAGFKKTSTNGISYIGLIQKTEESQRRYDLSYSKAVRRQMRSVDVVFAVTQQFANNEDCWDSLGEALKPSDKAPNGIIENQSGDFRPVQINTPYEDIKFERETYEADISRDTGFLVNMSDTKAVAVAQIKQFNNTIAPLWTSLMFACEHIAKVFQQFCFNGEVYEFSLKGGSDYISDNLERKQDLIELMEHTANPDMLNRFSVLYAKATGNEVLYQTALACLPVGSIVGIDTENEVGTISAALNEATLRAQNAEDVNGELQQAVVTANKERDDAMAMANDTKVNNVTQIESLKAQLQKVRNENEELRHKLANIDADTTLKLTTAKIKEVEAQGKQIENAQKFANTETGNF